MSRKLCVVRVIAITALVFALAIGPAAASIKGAAWTTAADGQKVNANLYDQKCPPSPDPCAVPPLVPFLNGGPSFASPRSWMPAGDYYFQVTDPAGKVLLSTDDVEARRFTIEMDNGTRSIVYPLLGNPAPHITCTDLTTGLTTIALCPFDDTPNPGGVYKLWITRVDDYNTEDPHARFGFITRYSKTDNFKVKQLASAWGRKVDQDGNPVEGLHVILYREVKVKGQVTWERVADTCTDGNGEFSFSNLSSGNYMVKEDLGLEDCDGCGCIDYSGIYEPIIDMLFFRITSSNLGRKGVPGTPVYVGQLENDDGGNGLEAAIQGVKFLDADGDGCLGAEEDPLAGWEICLEMPDGNGGWVQAVDADGIPVDCQETLASGLFDFGNLPVPMVYRVTETLKDGWLQTAPPDGRIWPAANGCGTADVTPADAPVEVWGDDGAYIVIFGVGSQLETIVGGLNFGNKLGELCVEKLQVCTEAPVAGVEFTLYGADCETLVTVDGLGNTLDNPATTDETGKVCWSNLLGGDYCVAETAMPGWAPITAPEVCGSLNPGEEATVTFYNHALACGLTPGYWKNWRNHYSAGQFCLLVEGTIADVGDCAADIAAADLIFSSWDASPDNYLTILKAFVLANQLTLNLTQMPSLPNPSDGSMVPESAIEYGGGTIILGEVLADALDILADPSSYSREYALEIKNRLAAFAESDCPGPPCEPLL